MHAPSLVLFICVKISKEAKNQDSLTFKLIIKMNVKLACFVLNFDKTKKDPNAKFAIYVSV